MLVVLVLLTFNTFFLFWLQRGLGSYAAEIEIGRMGWLVEILQRKYADDAGWSKLQGKNAAWFLLQTDGEERVADDPREGGQSLEPSYDAHRSGDLEAQTPSRLFLPTSMPRFGQDGRLASVPESFFERLAVVDATGAHIAGAATSPDLAARRPIRHNNDLVGYLVLEPEGILKSKRARAFLARQFGYIALAGLSGLILVLALSWPLAKRWVAPIDDLTRGAQSVARGRLDVRVPVRGVDEVALLGRTFNSMAERLDSIEASRHAWLTDVAHELRAPLAAMRAEIEALQDGRRSFDVQTAQRLHRKVLGLGRLVDELRSSMRDREEMAHTFAPVSSPWRC